MENEVWVEMWDFPNYEVSNLGNIRSYRYKKNLKVRQDGKQYRMASIYYDKKKYTKKVARYVWMSFNKKFCHATIDHINRDGSDDRIENLRCVSHQENMKNRQSGKKTNKYNLNEKIKGFIHKSITEGTETCWTIMKKFNIPLNYINTAIKRGSWAKYVNSN